MASFILTFHDVFNDKERKNLKRGTKLIHDRFQYIWKFGIAPYLQTQCSVDLRTIQYDVSIESLEYENVASPTGLQSHTNIGQLIYSFNETNDALVFPLLNYKTFLLENSLIFIPPSVVYSYYTIKSSRTRISLTSRFQFLNKVTLPQPFIKNSTLPIIYDEFISLNESATIMKILEDIPWVFGKTTFRFDKDNDYENMFWSKVIRHPYFSHHLLQKLQDTLRVSFKIHRLYINGQTFGQDGKFHTDDHRENMFTAIIYLSDFQGNDGGFTLFKNNDQITCIEPRSRRLVVFRSNIEHRALAPFREGGHLLRQVLVYKLQAI